MTSPASEPTLADVLAAVNALAAKVDGIDNKTDDLAAATSQGFGHVMTELAGVKADISALDSKVDVMEGSLRGEIRAAEARLTRKLDDVQSVVRSLKGDISAHLDDPTAHHRHAA